MNKPPHSQEHPPHHSQKQGADDENGAKEIAPKPNTLSLYSDFFAKSLDESLARKSSLEQRGITLVTTAGAIVALVFTIVSFVVTKTHGKGAVSPHHAIKGWITASLILFVFGAIAALFTNLPVSYGAADPRDLAGLLRDPKTDKPRIPPETPDVAAAQISLIRVKLLIRAKNRNRAKAYVLFVSICCIVAGVVCLAWGVHKLLHL